MRLSVVLPVITGLFAAVACGDGRPPTASPPNSILSQGLAATRTTEGIRLDNSSPESVAYLVWNRDWLGQFARCIDTSPGCLRLAVGTAVTVSLDDVVGYAAGMSDVIVSFWRVVPGGPDSYRAETIKEVTVSVR